MEISNNKMVTLTYDLRIDDQDGELIEQATPEKPLQFIFGAGVMLPKFETHLEGIKQGEPFEITLNKKDAYGEINNDAIIDLPRNVFIVDGKFDDELIKVGNMVPMRSSNGQRLNGIVLEVKEQNIKMDFNHPLAGEDLFFTGSVMEVREATDEEILQFTSVQGGCAGCDQVGEEDCGCSDEEAPGCGCGCN